MNAEHTLAYILHSSPYKNTSALIHCFSNQHGLITLVGRGVKRHASRNFLQPFFLLQLSWVGKSELKTLTAFEPVAFKARLSIHKIRLGLYLNELLMRLLPKQDPEPVIFKHYDEILSILELAENSLMEGFYLRQFELKLLAALGFGIELEKDNQGNTIEADLLYYQDPHVGLIESSGKMPLNRLCISGESLIKLRKGILGSEREMQEAKRFMRALLDRHLGDKPLQSRKLFILKNK